MERYGELWRGSELECGGREERGSAVVRRGNELRGSAPTCKLTLSVTQICLLFDMPSPFDAEVIHTANLFTLSEDHFFDIVAKFPALLRRMHARGRAIFGDRWTSWEEQAHQLHQTNTVEEGTSDTNDFSFHGTLGRNHAFDLGMPFDYSSLMRAQSGSRSSLVEEFATNTRARSAGNASPDMSPPSCQDHISADVVRARDAMLRGAPSSCHLAKDMDHDALRSKLPCALTCFAAARICDLC